MPHRSPDGFAVRLAHSSSVRWFACLFAALACATGPRRTEIDFGSPWHMAVGDSARAVGTVVQGSPNCSDYKYNSFDHPDRFTWTSSDPAVVSVDSLGWLRALAPGSARVEVIAEGRAAPVSVFVADRAAAAEARGAR
jgi:hypothetical protein